jgi:hypothetical protein
MNRVKLATSHEGKYSYWSDPDLYVYQRNELTGQWIGWLCTLAAWEDVFRHIDWIIAEKP